MSEQSNGTPATFAHVAREIGSVKELMAAHFAGVRAELAAIREATVEIKPDVEALRIDMALAKQRITDIENETEHRRFHRPTLALAGFGSLISIVVAVFAGIATL